MSPASKEEQAPRFKLCKPTSEEPATGTIKELLAEINRERNSGDGVELDLKSLGPALTFVSALTGRSYKSITELFPVSTLGTIKLLYDENEESGIQLFQYLTAPRHGAKPTFEFRTTGAAPRNAYRVKVVNDLLEKLKSGIADERLRKIETSLLTASKLLECIDLENREILGPVYGLYNHDDDFIISALSHLTEVILRYTIRHPASTIPLDELVYTNIRTLPFLHFVAKYKEILETARIEEDKGQASPRIEEFCIKVGVMRGMDLRPGTPVTSIMQFPALFEAHSRDFIRLVQEATGLPTQLRDLRDKLDYASKVLHMYVLHQNGKPPLEATVLSVSDCIAALCTVRHQQDAKTKYRPFWLGQEGTDIQTSVLRQLENGRRIEELYEEDYIPIGINQLLYSRFCQFHAQFNAQQGRHKAFQAFQVARLEKYAECLASGDIDQIDSSVYAFNLFCARQAISLAQSSVKARSIDSLNAWLRGAPSG